MHMDLRSTRFRAVTQSAVTAMVAVYFAFLLYVALTGDGMRNGIVSSHWQQLAMRTLAAGGVSTIASIGLWRGARWGLVLALILNAVAVSSSIYELVWGHWNIWGYGRVFTNVENTLILLMFAPALIGLLFPRTSRP